MLALVIGSFAMVVGWGCRVAWHYKPGSTAVYIPQTLVSEVASGLYHTLTLRSSSFFRPVLLLPTTTLFYRDLPRISAKNDVSSSNRA